MKTESRKALLIVLCGCLPLHAGGLPEAGLGRPRSMPLHFLMGNAPGDGLQRGKWIPGWDPDASARADFRYRQETGGPADSCCGKGGLEGGYRARTRNGGWGAFLALEGSGFGDGETASARTRIGHAGAEAGAWMERKAALFRGAGLSLGASRLVDEDSRISRVSDFASITDFSESRRDLWDLGATAVLAFGKTRILRMAASFSHTRGWEETGNSVRFDDESLRAYDSRESEALESGSRQVGGEADYLLGTAPGRMLILTVRSRHIISENKSPGTARDSLLLGLGVGWLAAMESGPILFQVAPSAEFGTLFFSAPGRRDHAYLGFLKPLDQDRSRKTLRLQAPQRLGLRLGGGLKAYIDYSIAADYGYETDGSEMESSSFSLRTRITAPLLAFEPEGRFSVALKPIGTPEAPGAELHFSASLQ